MRRPEQALQIQVASFLRVALKPPVWWTSIDHGVGKLGRAEAGLRKARGVKSGLPDLLVLADGPDGYMGVRTPLVVAIELKAGDGKQSVEQVTVQKAFEDVGAFYHVCRSLEEVIAVLDSYCIRLHASIQGKAIRT